MYGIKDKLTIQCVQTLPHIKNLPTLIDGRGLHWRQYRETPHITFQTLSMSDLLSWSFFAAREVMCRSAKNRFYTRNDDTYEAMFPIPRKLQWKTNAYDFGLCCEFATNDVRLILLNENENICFIHGIERFIVEAMLFIDATVPQDFMGYHGISRWKNIWNDEYSLSILFPQLLSAYLMIDYKYRLIPSTVIAEFILRIIERPTRSLGRDRLAIDGLCMLGPWLIANCIVNQGNEKVYDLLVNSEIDYHTVKEYAHFKYYLKYIDNPISHYDYENLEKIEKLELDLLLNKSELFTYSFAFHKDLMNPSGNIFSRMAYSVEVTYNSRRLHGQTVPLPIKSDSY